MYKNDGKGSLMSVLSFVCGLMMGGLEFFMTIMLIKKIIREDSGLIFFIIMIKVILWILFFAMVITFFRDTIFLAGIGAAASLITCGFASFVYRTFIKDKKIKGGEQQK